MRALAAALAALPIAVVAGASGCTSLSGLSNDADAGGDAASASDGATSDSPTADAPGGDDAAGDDAPAAAPARAQPLVKSTYETTAETATASITVTGGNLLVAAVYWCCGSSPASMTVKDSLGNTWQAATSSQDNYEVADGSAGICKADAQIFYAANIKGGADVVTVTRSSAAQFGFFLLEYSGIAATNPVAGSSGQANPTTIAPGVTLAAIPTPGGNHAVVALFVDTTGSGSIAPGAGWTTQGTNTEMFSMVEDTVNEGATVLPTAILPAPTNCWAGAAASFKP
jgi:hypothetical protein